MDTDCYYPIIETDDVYKGISSDVYKWFDPSNYEIKRKRPLHVRKNENVIGLMKDEKGRKIITTFAATAPTPHSYYVQKDNHGIQDLSLKRQKE